MKIIAIKGKRSPFQIIPVLRILEDTLAGYPKAAMFELFEHGYKTLFEQLISCIISVRTLDETTIPVSERLFAVARTPEQMLRLSPSQLEGLLHGCTFPRQKAYIMLGIAEATLNKYNGQLPADFKESISLKGVGPKCANLALGVAERQAAISVDVHVHRVTNRWGYVSTSSPEQTLLRLEQLVPKNLWININRLVMPFGKNICTGRLPHCSTCPVLKYCPQIGVTKYR